MKNLWPLCSLMAFVSLPAFAADIPADSTLKAATVYTGRATLTRQAVVDVPAGSHTIIFNNLSANMMTDSLRAEGSAASKVVLGAISHRLVAGAELAAPREQELSEQLVALQDQQRRIEAEKQGLTQKQAFLESLSKDAGARTREEIADINLKPEQWSQAGATIFKEISETLKGLVEQDIALRKLNDDIQKVQTELSLLQTGQKNSFQVTLPVEAAAATTLTIEINYQIPGATWTPLYDARLDTKLGKVDLVQYGSVQQNSGEDWKDIALTLSTAQPQRGTGLPDLGPFWLSLFDPQTAYRGRGDANMLDGAMMEMSAAPAAKAVQFAGGAAPMPMAPPVEAEFATAQIETGGFVSEYRIPGPSTVKADGTESKLMIGSFDSDSKMMVQVKPQMSTDAYLVANTTLKGESPILPGQVNLFRDGAFVGQSVLPFLRPGEDQDLAFGVDDQVSVKRKIMKDERSEAGVINKDNVMERHVLTEIQNLHTQAVDISVLETIPASQDKQIRVELLNDQTTKGYKDDTKNIKGLLSWVLKLEPKQKSDIKLGWKVSWPSDKELSGL